MPGTDSFTIFAELAIALAGFTGLLTAFQRKRTIWSDQERFRIRMLLKICFGIMVFALLPKVFEGSEPASESTWRIPTIGWSLFALYVCASTIRRILARNIVLAMRKSTWLLLLSGVFIHTAIVLGGGLKLWPVGPRELALGLIWGLLIGGSVFYATLSIVWKKEDAA